MNKKLQISIGIPAYNEEANIKKLLLSLLNQKGDNFMIKEIIVVSDKSTDKTVDEIKSIRNKKIKLIQNRERLGQAMGQNKIIKLFSGEILVLLNADVLPANSSFINRLVRPFGSDRSLGLLVPKVIPVKAQNLFEKVINYSIDFKDSVFEKWHNGSNLYMCSGRGRAFKRGFAKKLYWKDSLSEDAYSYFSCIEEGYKFKYVPSARLYFKSPDNFRDHIKQSARFSFGPKTMSKYFDKDFVTKEYSMPKGLALRTAIEYFVKNPLLFLAYLATFLIIKVYSDKKNFAQSKWQMSPSSKRLPIHIQDQVA